MRGGSKTLIAALVALLIAVSLAACGDDDSSSTTGAQANAQGQSEGSEASKQTEGDQGKTGGEDGQGGGSSGGGDGSGSSDSSSGRPDASDFAPRQHNDSGGGSEQYKVKGGDNSVQEFGDEAEPEEFDAAAVAVHNFLDARAEANWAAACEYMAKSVIASFEKLAAQAKQIEDTSCAGLLEKLTNPAAKQSMKEEAEKANVGSLRIEGEQAFVIYDGLSGTVLAMPMANEDGVWKVASLAGTPLN
ncbi:MAG: hypothetical protein WA687_07025 [Solirubrobacterales bacterium]